MISRSTMSWRWLVLPLVMLLTVTSCQGKREGCEEQDPNLQGNLTGNTVALLHTATPQDPETIRVIWETGPHADTYVISEENTNSTCAHCHAPMNWNPTLENSAESSSGNSAESASTPNFVSEGDWSHVGCRVCHNTENEQTESDLVWLENPSQQEYIKVDSSTALCEKCHLAAEVDEHESVIVEGSHTDFQCTDCHDAHDGTASCSASGCHEPFAQECERIQTHDKPHLETSCSACHDAGEPKIAWNEVDGVWDTFFPFREDSTDEIKPYTSHNIILEVPCERCHAPGNHPWGP
ncbi:MAG TPA: hypothetical protein G4O14_01500 [Anaerolineae bacterium]|nr:hypothetical protein [Anaerolineae bacterium]